jgi:hypothetical protein
MRKYLRSARLRQPELDIYIHADYRGTAFIREGKLVAEITTEKDATSTTKHFFVKYAFIFPLAGSCRSLPGRADHRQRDRDFREIRVDQETLPRLSFERAGGLLRG